MSKYLSNEKVCSNLRDFVVNCKHDTAELQVGSGGSLRPNEKEDDSECYIRIPDKSILEVDRNDERR